MLETQTSETTLVRSVIRSSTFDRSRWPSSVRPNHRSVAPVRSQSSCHGTMLEWCSISVMTTSSPGPTCRSPGQARVFAARLSASVAFLRKITSSRSGAPEERRHLVAGVLVGRRRLGAELVHGPGDVGVVALEVVDHRVDDHLRLLRGVRRVEVDQRLPVRRARATGSGSPCGRRPGRGAGPPSRFLSVRSDASRPAARLDVLVVALGLELRRRARGRPARRSGRPRTRGRSRARCSAGSGCSG